MDRTYSKNEKNNAYLWSEDLGERYCLGDLSVAGRIVL